MKTKGSTKEDDEKKKKKRIQRKKLRQTYNLNKTTKMAIAMVIQIIK